MWVVFLWNVRTSWNDWDHFISPNFSYNECLNLNSSGHFWGVPLQSPPRWGEQPSCQVSAFAFSGDGTTRNVDVVLHQAFLEKKHEWIKMWRIWKCSYQFAVWNKLDCWKKNEPKTSWCSTTQPFFGHLVGEPGDPGCWAQLIGNNTQWINSNSPSSGWDDEWPSHIFSQDFGWSPMVGMWTKNLFPKKYVTNSWQVKIDGWSFQVRSVSFREVKPPLAQHRKYSHKMGLLVANAVYRMFIGASYRLPFWNFHEFSLGCLFFFTSKSVKIVVGFDSQNCWL